MRVTIRHLERRTLPGDFESPPGVGRQECVAFSIRPHPTSSAIAIPGLFGQGCVTGVWDSRTGKLLWRPPRGSGISWSPDGSSVYLVVSKFGPGPRGGIGHYLHRYTWPDPELQEELFFSVPSGGADDLVISPAGGLAAAVAIEGPGWYYEVLSLRPALSQLGIGHKIPDYLVDGPAFSPDEGHIVTVGSAGYVWWGCPDEEEDEEEWQIPSEGGPHECGWIHVHDLRTDEKSRHTLTATLPDGWLPQPREGEPDGWSWKILWGPRFLDADTFRIWLPDGSPLDLRLPLPETIHVPPLSQTWRGPVSP